MEKHRNKTAEHANLAGPHVVVGRPLSAIECTQYRNVNRPGRGVFLEARAPPALTSDRDVPDLRRGQRPELL